MTLKDRITATIVQFFIETPAKRMGLTKLLERLEKTGQDLQASFSKARLNEKNAEKNSKQLSHIITLERWGQRRLKVALGEPFVKDESSAYKPTANSFQDLQNEFQQTRAQTLAIVRELDTAGVDLKQTISHNQMGELSVLAWLRYLSTHAALEGKRIR